MLRPAGSHVVPLLMIISTSMCLAVVEPLAAQTEAPPLEGVEIERVAVSLQSPKNFHIPLRLEPTKSLRIVAPMDGVVEAIFFKAGDSVRSQSELVRFKSKQQQLEFRIAQSEHELAKLEQQLLEGSQKQIAAARVDVAKKKLELAEFFNDSTIVRAPIDGVLSKRLVSEGDSSGLGIC